MKIITFDSETRGFFGGIFAFGYYDGQSFNTCNPIDFIGILEKSYGADDIYAFAHNLDFDFAKLYKAHEKAGRPFLINWDKTLVIRNQVARVSFLNTTKKVILCDSYMMLPYSLDSISKTFQLSVKKIDMEEEFGKYGGKQEYFKNVPANDCKMLEYLKNDCISLYEVLQQILTLSELPIKDFLKCPTAASLAMKIYKKLCPKEYKLITDVPYSPILEDFSRESYIGARVEVVKPVMEKGYHYDINSLYPFIMRDFNFPVGGFVWKKKAQAQGLYDAYKNHRRGIYRADVFVPEDIYIPVLPCREGKLYFPVGEFSGVWTDEELQTAERQGAIVKVTEAMVWRDSFPIFKTFIEKMEHEKNNSTGARRAFFKLIQNSLYGKFGMRRERDTYKNDTPENREKIIKQGGKFLTIILACGKTMLLTTSRSYASYIQPQISSYITSLARLELFKAIDKYQDDICYYDTDSIVLTKKLAEKMVDVQEYGKWKLEGEVEEAVFIQPKMYAEMLKNGKEVLKSKGLVRGEVEKLSYKSYIDIMDKVKKGTTRLEMYKDVPARQKFITSLIQGEDTDTIVYLRKSLNLRQTEKREIDYLENTSKPLVFRKLEKLE